MGERSPVWNTDAKGVIFGLSLAHTKAHIYRAFLEAVAYSLRHTMESTGEDLGEYILLAGGVSKSPLWRQIFADVTGHAVVCPIHDVEANLGDVMLAGLGTGTLTLEDIRSWQVLDEKVRPDPEAHAKYNDYYKLYHAVYRDPGTGHGGHIQTVLSSASRPRPGLRWDPIPAFPQRHCKPR